MTRVWTVVLSFLSNVLALALPLALIQVYDRILPNQALGTAAVLFAAVLVAILLDGMARFARSAIFSRIGCAEEFRLSIAIARHVLAMTRDEFRRIGAGQIEALFTAVTRSRDVLVGQTLLGMFDAPFAVVFLILVWFLGGPVVLVPVSIVAVIGLLAYWSAHMNSQAVTDQFAARSAHTSLLMNALDRIELFRTRGHAGELMARLRRSETAAAEAAERSERHTGTLMDLTQISSVATSVGILGLGSMLVLDGRMSVGSLAACLILGQRAVSGLVGILSGLARRQTAAAAHRILQNAMAAGREYDLINPGDGAATDGNPIGLGWQTPDGRKVDVSPGAFTVVEFPGFDDADTAFLALSDALASFGINSTGGSQALALKPACSDQMPQEMETAVRPSLAVTASFVSQVAMVRAMPALFRGTILENMTGFDPARIEVAMVMGEALGLNRPIGRLAHGYQTQVGVQFGSPLSSGAIKRIGLVRAFAGAPGLVILNNPSYSLDKDGVDRLLAFLRDVTTTTTVVVLTREGAFADLTASPAPDAQPAPFAAEDAA